jgi:hypothetical protein
MSLNPFTNLHFMDWEQTKKIWREKIAPIAVPAIAGGVAIIPVSFLFERKSAYQLGLPKPQITYGASLINGSKVFFPLGCLIGFQVFTEKQIKKHLFSSPQKPTLAQDIIAATITGALCVHGYAAFNNAVMGLSLAKAFKEVRLQQAGALAGREGMFVLSLSLDKRINELIKPYLGDNIATTALAIMVSAYASNILVHPLDTVQLWAQKAMPVVLNRSLYNGGHTRAAAMVGFNLAYKTGNYLLEPI